MEKFNKKAIFVALMGALSSVTSFGVNRQIIDNVELYKMHDKNLRFLNKDDFDLNNSEDKDKLNEIFEQIVEISDANFDTDFLNPSFITNQKRLQTNLEKYKTNNQFAKPKDYITPKIKYSEKKKTDVVSCSCSKPRL